MAIFILVAWFSDVVPVKLIWTSSLTGLIGGGNAVVMASLSGILADVLPEAERYVVCFSSVLNSSDHTLTAR